MKLYVGIGAFFGVIAFLAGWVYCIAEYGFLLGGSLGWFPSAILAFVVACIWPLVALAAAALAYVMVEPHLEEANWWKSAPLASSSSAPSAPRDLFATQSQGQGPALGVAPAPGNADRWWEGDPTLVQVQEHDAWHLGWTQERESYTGVGPHHTADGYKYWHADWHRQHDTKYLTHRVSPAPAGFEESQRPSPRGKYILLDDEPAPQSKPARSHR